ncbi:unnamed protein product, partial [Adineta ricciae]
MEEKMNHPYINFIDLPVEILYIILNKLDNVDVLYSLFGINNKRLDFIIQDHIFSNTLNLTKIVNNAPIFDRFRNFIIPEIRSNVKCLIVDSSSIEQIHYPNVNHLKFTNFQRDNSLQHFQDESPVGCILKNQITKLELTNIDRESTKTSWERYTQTVYAHILNYSKKLEHLGVLRKTVYGNPPLLVHNLSANTFSSCTLTYLSIYVSTFTDCLCLLDGRLKQLNT